MSYTNTFPGAAHYKGGWLNIEEALGTDLATLFFKGVVPQYIQRELSSLVGRTKGAFVAVCCVVFPCSPR